MRIPSYIIFCFLLCSCAGWPTKQSESSGHVSRTAKMTESEGNNAFVLTDREGNRVSTISFKAPKKQLIDVKNIKDYEQQTSRAGHLVWSGGGIEDGFIYVNKMFPPFYIEIHAIERGDCSCRHLQPYFANGRYYIR